LQPLISVQLTYGRMLFMAWSLGRDLTTFSTDVPAGTDRLMFLQEHKRDLQCCSGFAQVFRAEHLWKTNVAYWELSVAYHFLHINTLS